MTFLFNPLDADLAVNALVSDFELLGLQALVDASSANSFFTNLLSTGSQFVSYAALAGEFGFGQHTFVGRVADRYLASINDFVSASFRFNVPSTTVPEPNTLALVGIVLAGLGYSRRKAGRKLA